MRALQAAVVALFLLAFSGPARAQFTECKGASKPQQVAELIFGRSVAGSIEVTDAQWTLFVDNEITPRFPDGLTVFEATGQWRDQKSNRIIREPSKIVLIVLPGHAEDIARLNEVVEVYKRSFRQQSVGLILRPSCVLF
jgi:hypothetical protein